jgi:hypothetical protein
VLFSCQFNHSLLFSTAPLIYSLLFS